MGPLKGVKVVEMAAGSSSEVRFDFKHGGKGTCSLIGDAPMVWRESGSQFSASCEVSREISPISVPFTLVMRGARSSDKSFTAVLRLISDDPVASDLGFLLTSGTASGKRLH